MDTQQQSDHITLQLLHPAQLWIGPHDIVLQKTISYMQNIFCQKNGCGACTECKHITQQQHHAIVWLYPEKYYTIDHINTIFSTITFGLNTGEQFFFVLQKADFLPPASANKLLKSIEEPPPGYHFLLLAERKEQVILTIRSRCIIQTFYGTSIAYVHSELFDCFTTKRTVAPTIFLTLLDKSHINERETQELLDSLISYWTNEYKKYIRSNTKNKMCEAQKICTKLTKAAHQPPMPGSSKLFWRNLFLQMSE